MVTVAIDLSEAEAFVEEIRREGGVRLKACGNGYQGCRAVLEALLRMELALMLEREQTAGVVNWRDGYHNRTLSLAGLGRLEFLIPRDRLLISVASWCRFASSAARSWKKLSAETFPAGLSTRDVARVLERHFGERFDSKEMLDGGRSDGEAGVLAPGRQAIHWFNGLSICAFSLL